MACWWEEGMPGEWVGTSTVTFLSENPTVCCWSCLDWPKGDLNLGSDVLGIGAMGEWEGDPERTPGRVVELGNGEGGGDLTPVGPVTVLMADCWPSVLTREDEV